MKIKVCLIGDNAVGKTSLVHRYLQDEFSDEYHHTMGAKVYKTVVRLPMELRRRTVKVDMTLWDVSGDTPMRALSDEGYFQGVQGVLVVCDITRKTTVDSLDEWNATLSDTVRSLPMHIIVNKNDLVNQIEIVEDDVFRLGEMFSSPILMTSAKTGSNVRHAFESLAKSVLEREFGPDIDFLVEQRFGSLECHA